MENKINILGVGFDNISHDGIRPCIEKMLAVAKRQYIVTPNPEILEYAKKDEEYKSILNRADLCVADGIGIVYASKILGADIKERIPGIEIGECVLSLCAETGERVFLLGAKQGVAEKAASRLCEKYRGLCVSGVHHGYFGCEENGKVADEINRSKASVVFVCMGAPYQEKWIAQNISKLENVKLALALGGSLDVYSGKVKRAPAAFRLLGIEWLWRCFCSPARFARMLRMPVFVLDVLRERRKNENF